MAKADLAQAKKAHDSAVRRAHRNAGISLGLGFMGCVGQLTGIYSGVYIFYDWNVMEPFTWMFCKFLGVLNDSLWCVESFYMMVGSMFFLRYRGDWKYASVYENLYQRNLKNITEKEGVDLRQAQALEGYIHNLE